MKELAAFHQSHATALAKIGVKGDKKRARARVLASELESLVARRRTEDRADAASLDVRDRASTLLVHAMGEIRAGGVYAFRGNPTMSAKFRSSYLVQRRARAARKEKTMPSPAPDPTRPS